MTPEEIATLNEAYAKIADFPDRVKEAQNTLTRSFEFEDEYRNPIYTYDSDKLIKELRSNLITFTVRELTKGVNYEINEQEIVEHLNTIGPLRFDAQDIVNYINENYEAKADELSLKAIKAKVAHLVPHFDGQKGWHTRKPELNELVKKDTLLLKCWLSWEYRFNYGEFMERMTAFEKYVEIELTGVKPSEVTANVFEQAYSNEDGLGVRGISGSFYQSVQLHKNSTLRVRFKPGYAEKIGNAMLRDFYEGCD